MLSVTEMLDTTLDKWGLTVEGGGGNQKDQVILPQFSGITVENKGG